MSEKLITDQFGKLSNLKLPPGRYLVTINRSNYPNRKVYIEVSSSGVKKILAKPQVTIKELFKN